MAPTILKNAEYWRQHRFAESVTIWPTNGYCYLLWFRQLGYPLTETMMVADHLGPNPKLYTVLALMLTRPADLEGRLFSDCDLVSSRLLHCVSDARPYVQWSDLIKKLMLITKGSFDTYRIGSTMEDTVNTDAAVIAEILRTSGGSVSQIIADHVREEAEKPASDLKNILFKQLIDQSRMRQTAKALTSLHVPYRLEPFEVSELINNFPEIKFTFHHNQRHPHALAAVVRKCEEALFLYRLNYRSTTYVPEGCDVFIKDIGGNVRSHLERLRMNIHSCTPTLSPQDGNRKSELYAFLDTKRNSFQHGKYVRDAVLRNLMFCENKAQDCCIRASAAIFVHSFYDMSVTDIADAMDRSGATTAWGSIIFDPEILIATPEKDSGIIKSLNMSWTVEFKKRKPVAVLFGFVGDCSYQYRHGYANYLAIISTAAYVSSKGNVYYAQMRDSRFSTYHIQLNKNVVNRVPRGVLHHRLWVPSMDKFTVVQYYDYNLRTYPRTTQNLFYKINLIVPTRLVEQGKMYAYSLSPQKFTLTSIYEYLRAINARVVVNGVDVETPVPVNADTLYKLAHALYVYAFVQRYNQSQTVQRITENIKNVRSSYAGNFFETIIAKIKSFSLWNWLIGNIDREPGDVPLSGNSEDRGILAKIFCWFAVEELLPVTINDAVRYYQYSTVVKEQIQEHVTPMFIHNKLNREDKSRELERPPTLFEDPAVLQALTTVRDYFGDEKPDNQEEINNHLDRIDELLAKVQRKQNNLKETLHEDDDYDSAYTTDKDPEESEKEISPTDAVGEKLADDDEESFVPLEPVEPELDSETSDILKSRVLYEIVKCTGGKFLIQTPGDGSCMYHALIGALKLDCDVHTLRHKLATSSFVKSDEMKKTLYNEWGNVDVLRIASMFFNVNVCVHEADYTNTQFIIRPTVKTDRTIHLHFLDRHYSYYSDTDECYKDIYPTNIVENASTLSALPSVSFNNDITPLLRTDVRLETPPYIPMVILFNSETAMFKVYGATLYLYVQQTDVATGLKLIADVTDKEKRQRIFVVLNAEDLNLDIGMCRSMVKKMTLKSAIRVVLYYKKPNSLTNSINRLFAVPSSNFNYVDKPFYQGLFKSNHIHPEFKPKRRPCDNPLAVMRNAMDEIRSYWYVRDLITREHLTLKYNKLNSKVLSPRDYQSIKESPEGYGLLGRNGKWIQEPAIMKKYECVFDGKDFIHYEKFLTDCDDSSDGFVIVCDEMVLMQDVKLFDATRNIDIEGFKGVEIEFRQGVPGCGKTYNYLQTCIVPTGSSTGDLVLFPTRQGADEFRRDIKKKYPEISDIHLRRNYRTMDSYLLNGTHESFQRVLVDEALMAHAGQILLAVHKARATKLIMIGDEKQIKFINRVPQCDIQYSDPCQFVRPTVYLSTSWRCTLTVAALLSDGYEQGMKSVSSVIGEMKLVIINNLSGVKVEYDSTQFLVFKQSEKAQMIANGFTNTVTIHEYQGKQAAHVAVVRINAKKEDIYSSAPHILVAVSRHTRTFTYFTSVTNDKLSAMVTRSSRFNISNCERYLDKKAGGGIPITMVPYDRTVELDCSEATYSCGRKYGYPLIPLRRLDCDIGIESMPGFCKYLSCDPTVKDYQHVQEFYNYVFPNNAYHSLEFDTDQVLTSNLHINLEATSFNPQYKYIPKAVKYDRMRPVLQTAMPLSRPSNQVESMLAMVKRNQAVPSLAGVVDNDLLARTLFDKFVVTYLINGTRSMFRYYKSHPITCNEYATSEWLQSQPTGTSALIEQNGHLRERNLTLYNFMIKSTVKPQLDHNAPYTYNALQTIAYHEKDVNAIFCPVFREINRRILPLLKKKFIINTEMTVEDLESRLKRCVRPRGFLGRRILEVDMSKYDKSQGQAMLEFECMLMLAVGVDGELVGLWRNAHERTTLSDRANKIRCRVNYQRKSGDASTFSGNTMYLMAVLATLIALDDVDFAVFAGDDSLIVGGDDLDQDLNSVCAKLFNLESKFFRQYRNPYFCSKFVIVDDGECFVVPDPLKLITKLGRRDLVNAEHVEQYRVSLCDIVKHFKNVTIYPLIDRAVNERYNVTGSHDNVYSTIYNVVNDKELFTTLFYSLETDNINLDPSLPDITK